MAKLPLSKYAVIKQSASILVGLILLVLGANWLVDGASSLARAWGISDLAIGLTIVAVGTSLPELITSILAAIRGESEIAVGNIVGSNLFNLLSVLGASAAIAPGGIDVTRDAIAFDIPLMIVVAEYVARLARVWFLLTSKLWRVRLPQEFAFDLAQQAFDQKLLGPTKNLPLV